MARASAREARYWIQRAVDRRLVPAAEGQARIDELTEATRALNSLIRYRRSVSTSDRIGEDTPPYPAEGDPFHDWQPAP